MARSAPLPEIAREWTRIGITGFGGPPAHIELLRRLISERSWLDTQQFEDAIAACNMLPGPASTQLAIFCAQRAGGQLGAVVGGVGFVAPAVVLMIALSALFLGHSPPSWVRGAGAGAGAAVAAVAVRAALSLARPSLGRTARRARWLAYALVGAAAAALIGSYLVIVLIACGAMELALRRGASGHVASLGLVPVGTVAVGGLGALAWVALKVGGLSFGGGLVIVPLMQHDAVHTYHWMSATAFLTAVALGQVTPGPVVSTVAAVGYAARGVGGGVLAAVIAFLPSFALVIGLGPRFERLRANPDAQGFLAGAGPAAIGAIFGAAIPLAGALKETWQIALLAAAAVALLVLHRGVVMTLVCAGAIGAIVGLAGVPLPR
jgi:chromate transporter